MAEAGMYMTVTYVEPERLKCANSNCPQRVITGKRLDARLHGETDASMLWVRLYFCDDCYPRYKQTIDQVEIDMYTSPGCQCGTCQSANVMYLGMVK